MKRNKVGAETYTNSQTLQEGIAMTFQQFSRRIGAALAIGVALALTLSLGFPGESVAQNPPLPCGFTLAPTAGATTPGGQVPLTITANLIAPQCAPPNTWLAILSPQTPQGITMTSAVGTFPGTVQALIRVASTVSSGTYSLVILITAQSPTGAPVGYAMLYFPLVVRGSGGGNPPQGPNPPPGSGPCQFNFAFDPPVGNLVQVQNTQDPMAWAWEARMTILATAQGNCPATSRFTARLAPGTGLFPLNVGKMMQPQVVQGNIPGRSVTATISVRNSALGPAAVVEICATQSVNQQWRCQNYNYQLRRGGGGSTPPGPGPGQARVRLVATPNPARLGETITFQLINEGPNTLQLPNPAPWRIVYQGQTFSPGAVIQVITNVAPGETRSWTWDQRTPMGNQAPAGDYTFIVTTLNGDPREPSVQFSIRDAGGSSPLPPTAPPPMTGLQAFIRTDRGCQETGENPIYSVGEQIIVSFRVDGVAQALVTIEDIMDSGERQIVFQQWVAGNQLLQLTGQIVPPTGRETLRLTAQVGQQSVVSECSFTSQ